MYMCVMHLPGSSSSSLSFVSVSVSAPQKKSAMRSDIDVWSRALRASTNTRSVSLFRVEATL